MKSDEKTAGTPKSEGLKFEEGLRRLEEIVRRLESGDLELEEALKAYEGGVGLVRRLNETLTTAEHRIEILSRAEDGSVELREEEGE